MIAKGYAIICGGLCLLVMKLLASIIRGPQHNPKMLTQMLGIPFLEGC